MISRFGFCFGVGGFVDCLDWLLVGGVIWVVVFVFGCYGWCVFNVGILLGCYRGVVCVV